MEKVLEFKEVPKNKQVPIVATIFQERVASWWQHSKMGIHWVMPRWFGSIWDCSSRMLRDAQQATPLSYGDLKREELANIKESKILVH